VKESKGKLGIMTACRCLYRTFAEEGVDIVEHISQLRKTQEELALMGSLVSDDNFIMLRILVTAWRFDKRLRDA
jgi:hypothetical protein